DPDRVAELDRLKKLPFGDLKKCQGLDPRALAGQAGGDGHAVEAVGDGLARRPAAWSLVGPVERIVISGKARESNHIGVGARSAGTFPLVADDQVVKKKRRNDVPRHGNISESERNQVTIREAKAKMNQ